LVAHFPGGISTFSLGQFPPCQSSTGQIFALFGSPLNRGSQPASLSFPRVTNPRLMRPGGLPPTRAADSSHSQSRDSRRCPVARPPLHHHLFVVAGSPPQHLVAIAVDVAVAGAADPPPSRRFGHSNGEPASAYISMPRARVSFFLIRSSQTVPLGHG